MMTQEEFMDVVALRRQGWTITDIAAEVGRHPDTISKWLRAGGPPARRQVADTVIDQRWARRIEELLARNRNLLASSVYRLLLAEGFPHAQFLAELVAAEAAATRNRRMAARLRFAHFPARRTLAEFDFDFQPSVDRKLIEDLASLRFVAEGRPLLLLGQPGCGKSHLAIALATLAVEVGYRGYFTSAADLVATISGAYADGSFATRIRTYTGRACR
jgi:DNA replication protein DnaC